MEIIFQAFGSKSSQDMDCMVFVDQIGSIQESHDFCKAYGNKIQEITKSDKDINTNLCVVKDGNVVDCFKGSFEEVNNSLLLTYDFHTQYHPLQIESVIPRNIELKILRCCRSILMYWSRTLHRTEVKRALKGDIYSKMILIDKIDMLEITDLNKPAILFEDYLKNLAFQIGQTIALINGKELYTKEDISDEYPKLGKYLRREENIDLIDLGFHKEELMSMIRERTFLITKEEL